MSNMRISSSLFNQRGLNGILEQQSRLIDIQTKIASGKRITSPSDDPSGAVQIIRLNQTQSITEQYIRNSDTAIDRLQLEETAIKSVQDSLVRVKELAVQAGNTVLSDQDRRAIASEVRQQLLSIVGLANTQDSNLDYLFSGNAVSTIPFTQLAGGQVVYNGDQGQRAIQISSGQQVNDSDPGTVFMDIVNGNGEFTVVPDNANTGTGVIDPGQVFDSSAYVSDSYTINFVINGNGNLAYNIIGAGSGQVVPALPLNAVTDAPDFAEGAAIRFNGIETKIEGTPAVGDSFDVDPSGRQDLFSTLSNLVTALERNTLGPENRALLRNDLSTAMENIDRAQDKMIEVRSSIGARLKLVEERTLANESFLVDVSTILSDVEDLDIVSAATELQQRLTSLQAAQSAFVRIQGLSLFNFIR